MKKQPQSKSYSRRLVPSPPGGPYPTYWKTQLIENVDLLIQSGFSPEAAYSRVAQDLQTQRFLLSSDDIQLLYHAFKQEFAILDERKKSLPQGSERGSRVGVRYQETVKKSYGLTNKVSTPGLRTRMKILRKQVQFANSPLEDSYLSKFEALTTDPSLTDKEENLLKAIYGFFVLEPVLEGSAYFKRESEILAKMKQLSESAKPAIRRFLNLISSGNTQALARVLVRSVGIPLHMKILQQKWEEESDAQALSEVLSRYEEEFGTIEDPALIRDEWLRRAIVKFARDTLPMVGSGPHTDEGKPALTPKERRANFRNQIKEEEKKLRQFISVAEKQVSPRHRNSQQLRAEMGKATNSILTQALTSQNLHIHHAAERIKKQQKKRYPSRFFE